MRRDELIPSFGLTGYDSVDLVVDVYLFQKVLAYVSQQLMQVAVVVVDVARIWCSVVVLFKVGERDAAVDAQLVNWYKALVAGLLLNDGELSVFEVFRADAHQVGVSLA